MSDEKKKYRYPGLRSFEPSESNVFFGRNDEIQDLYSLIKSEKVVTLFGKSGLGKSSLINAGLCNFLADKNYYIIRVRFGIDQSFSPLALFYSSIRKDSNIRPNLDKVMGWSINDLVSQRDNEYDRKVLEVIKQVVDEANPPRVPNLWEVFKRFFDSGILDTPSQSVELSTENTGKIIPLLIFDQFEEFFTYPTTSQKTFLTQVSELCYNDAPSRILDPLIKKDAWERTAEDALKSKQPNIRILFSLRSDALHHLDAIKIFFPWATKNRYRLAPLNTDKAKLAIQNPAKSRSEEYAVPGFEYDEQTLTLITGFLGGSNDQVESSQLQIICNYIESKLEELHLKKLPKFVVDSSIIDERNIQRIIHQYYYTQLRKLRNFGSLTRKILEEDLVASGRRASLTYDQLLAKVHPHKNLIAKMLESRLIREEYTHLGLTFEISHDTLVPAIERAYKRRKADEEKGRIRLEMKASERRLQEKRRQLELETELRKKALVSERRFKILSGILAMAIAAIAFLLYRNWENLQQRNEQLTTILSFQAESQYDQGRYFKAFRFWEIIETLGKQSDLASRKFYPVGGKSIEVTTDEKFIVSSFGDEFDGDDKLASGDINYMVDVWRSVGGKIVYDHLIKGVKHIELIPKSRLAIITRNDSINSKQIYDLQKQEALPLAIPDVPALNTYAIDPMRDGNSVTLYKDNEPLLLYDLRSRTSIKPFAIKYVFEEMGTIQYNADQTKFLLAHNRSANNELHLDVYFRDIRKPEANYLGNFEGAWPASDYSRIAVRTSNRTVDILETETETKIFTFRIPQDYVNLDISISMYGDYVVLYVDDFSSPIYIYSIKSKGRVYSFEAFSYYSSDRYSSVYFTTDSGTTVIHFKEPFKIQKLDFKKPRMLRGERFLVDGNHFYDLLKREHRVFRNNIKVQAGTATYVLGEGQNKVIVDAFTNRVIYRRKDSAGLRFQAFSRFVLMLENNEHGEIVLFRDTLKNDQSYLKTIYPDLLPEEKTKYGLKK